MHRRLWISVAALALGVSLLAAAGFASPASSSVKSSSASTASGTLNVNMSATDVDFTDPALAYYVPSWQIEYVTCAKLLNYPDKGKPVGGQLRPEVATGFPTVSNGGKTYVFHLRNSFRFNTGAKVTAANFAAAINRDLNPSMQSPAAAFIGDIAGAENVLKGKAKTASGVKASGLTLRISLTKPAPDFLARIAMPFFCAIPTNLPIDPKGVNTLAGAGPYYIASRTVNRQIVLKRNPHYTGDRPHSVNQFVITVNTDLNQSLLQVRQGSADYDAGGLPSTAAASLSKSYGVNKSRFFVSTEGETDYLALNNSRPTFSKLNLRKAANNAIDRPALLRLRGKYAGKRTDQILPPTIPGYRPASIYPLAGANVSKAKALAGNSCGNVTIYGANKGIGPAQVQVAKYNFEQMGCKVDFKLLNGGQVYTAAGTKGEPFDAVFAGWVADYPDPFDFIDILLNGQHIHATNNNNLAYFNEASYNKKMLAAAKLSGSARYSAFGKLDVDITAHAAPWVAIDNRNVREFVSSRTKGYTFQPAYGSADYATFRIG